MEQGNANVKLIIFLKIGKKIKEIVQCLACNQHFCVLSDKRSREMAKSSRFLMACFASAVNTTVK